MRTAFKLLDALPGVGKVRAECQVCLSHQKKLDRTISDGLAVKLATNAARCLLGKKVQTLQWCNLRQQHQCGRAACFRPDPKTWRMHKLWVRAKV